MAVENRVYYSMRQAREELLELVCAATAQGRRAIVIASDYNQTIELKRFLAARGAGFGVAVSTFDGWLRDLWGLYGDGASIVSGLERSLHLWQAAKAELGGGAGADASADAGAGDPGLLPTPGCVKLLERITREGYAAARESDMANGAFGQVAAVLRRYGGSLAERGLIEPTQACEALSQLDVLNNAIVVVLDVPLTLLQRRFIEDAQAYVLEVLWETEGVADRPEELCRLQRELLSPRFDDPIVAEGHVRFALPSGSYAAYRLVLDELQAWFEEHGDTRVAIATPWPLAWFEWLAPKLAKEGVASTVSAVRRFDETRFGSAWCALLDFANQGDARRDLPAVDVSAPAEEAGAELAATGGLDARLAGDFALSAFSAIPAYMARVADSRFRGWRAQTVDDAFTDLTAFADEDHRDIAAAFAEGDFERALQAELNWIAAQRRWPDALRTEALSAVACAQRVHAEGRALGLEAETLSQALASRQLRTELHMPAEPVDDSGASADSSTMFLTLADLAVKPAGSFDCVVFTDFTAEAYPLSDDHDAADALLDAWGTGPAALQEAGAFRSGTQRMQKAFSSALATARERVVLCRSVNDREGEQERPSALFEEVVDCYRRDPQNPDEIDETTGLTESLAHFAALRGEQDTVGDIAGHDAPELTRRIPLYPTGAVAPAARSRILLPRILKKGAVADEPCLSPSAIESYLECPHLWFARRRLRLDTVDADFGGLAFGNFAHHVLERLHCELRERGMRRVTVQNAEEAVALMNVLFDKCLAAEQGRFQKDALIPCNELERLEVEQLRHKLAALVRREALFLPDFVPLGEEMSFGEADGGFSYAGVRVNGKVDRIDVDSFGRAVVIDYKGSVDKRYAFRQSEDDEAVLPRKMQTLIYAQMVRRTMGLVPVGALYLSYGKDEGVFGLFDRTVLDGKADLLGMSPEMCGTDRFLEALDAAEEEVQERIERLLAGDIAPAAQDEKTCKYCPVGMCDHREALVAAKQGGAN